MGLGRKMTEERGEGRRGGEGERKKGEERGGGGGGVQFAPADTNWKRIELVGLIPGAGGETQVVLSGLRKGAVMI
jgi:hypothetical protein